METKNITNNNAPGEAQSIIAAAEKYGAVEMIEVGERKIASIPTGRTLKGIKSLLDEYLTAPERKKGKATFTTLASFIDHVNRTKDADSVIFADDSASPGLLAVYDYNRAGEVGAPRFGDHRAQYTFPLSDEWKAWTAASNIEAMSMETFAEFLEDRIVDVILPETGFDSIKEFAVNLGLTLATPQQLMTLSRGLAVSVGQTVVNATNIGSGEGQITFSEEHKDAGGAPIRVPGGFAIQIPIFRGGAVYQVPVRLRYRVGRGQIAWSIGLHRTQVVFQDALDEALAKTAEATSLPVLCGSPEKA